MRARAATAWRQGAATVAAILVIAAGRSAAAQETPAGTPVTNTATLRSDRAGVSSNPVTIVIAERLDVALSGGAGAASGVAVAVLVNRGNGAERFDLSAAADDGRLLPIAVDGDGDGRFDPAHDPLLATPERRTAPLAPGARATLFVIGEGRAGPAVLVGRAATGSGTPGTAIAGAGDGGGDAVVGPTGASAQLPLSFATGTPPTIVEAQSVRADDGSAVPRPGAVVTYTIDVAFTEASAAASVRNPVPANTRYRANTLTLDGVALPDAGHVADDLVVVPLGAVAAGAGHRITFQAIIQGATR